MKVTLVVDYFPPEIGSAADLFYQLAKAFNAAGHEIKVVTTEPRYYNVPGKQQNSTDKQFPRLKLWTKTLDPVGFTVNRLKLLPIIYPRSGTSAKFRSLEHLLQPFAVIFASKELASSDVILVYSPPLLLGYLLSLYGKIFRISVVVNVQDLHPQAVIDLGLVKNSAEIRLLELIERSMYRYSSAVVVHSDGNKEIVDSKSPAADKVHVIHNACIIPSQVGISSDGAFRRKLNLDGKFLITYAGILSYSQDLETIIRAAALLIDHPDIVFVIAGEGPNKTMLLKIAEELKTKNVFFVPFQKGEEYWHLILNSDICLVSLRESKVKTPVVPRKLNEIMASKKIVVANVPLKGDVDKIISTAKCGYSVESENPKALSDALLQVYKLPVSEREKMGQNGYVFACQNFALKVILDKYSSIFLSLQNKTSNKKQT